MTDIGFVLVFPGFGMVLFNGFGFLINVVEHQSTSGTKRYVHCKPCTRALLPNLTAIVFTDAKVNTRFKMGKITIKSMVCIRKFDIKSVFNHSKNLHLNYLCGMKTVHLKITGKVQGVFFRAKAKEIAEIYHISGWIRNKMMIM